MTTLFSRLTTAVASPPLASLGGEPDSGEVLVWVGAAALSIAAIVAGLVFANRAAQRRRKNSHPGLFAGLCRHHNLDRNRRSLLKSLGQAHRVRYPARVFLDPTLFDPKRLPPALRSRKDEILALRQQLFAISGDSPLKSGD